MYSCDTKLSVFQLDSELTGTDAQVRIVAGADGGVFFDPVPGDMIRNVHSEPQVSIDSHQSTLHISLRYISYGIVYRCRS